MQKGDTVSAIDEPIKGVVTSIEGSLVIIETEEGFPMKFQKDELIVEGALLKKNITSSKIAAAISEKETFRKISADLDSFWNFRSDRLRNSMNVLKF